MLHAIFFLMGGELFLISPLLPTIADDLGTSIPATALVVTAYGLTYAVASPLLGALAEHVARRRVILAGVAVMVLGRCSAWSRPRCRSWWGRAWSAASAAP